MFFFKFIQTNLYKGNSMYQLIIETIVNKKSKKYIIDEFKSIRKAKSAFSNMINKYISNKNDFCILTIRQDDSILESKIF